MAEITGHYGRIGLLYFFFPNNFSIGIVQLQFHLSFQSKWQLDAHSASGRIRIHSGFLLAVLVQIDARDGGIRILSIEVHLLQAIVIDALMR